MIGIDPASLVPLAQATNVPNAPERFVAVAKDWIEDRFGADWFKWEAHWHYAPYELLARVFTREELIRLWHGFAVASKLDDHLLEHDELLWKVRHTLYRYGGSVDYARFVEVHNGLGRLTVNQPNFELRISHTRSINTAAWAAHGRDVTNRSTSMRRSACFCITRGSTC